MIIAIRLLHVVGGIFWIGVILFNAVFLGPRCARPVRKAARSWASSCAGD